MTHDLARNQRSSLDLSEAVEVLKAYLYAYEPMIADQDLPKVAATVVATVTGAQPLQAGTRSTTGSSSDALGLAIQQIISAIDRQHLNTNAPILSATGMAKAAQVAQQLTQDRSQQLAQQVATTLLARLKPHLTDQALPKLVSALIPKPTSHLTQQEVRSLTQQIIATFSPELATRLTSLEQTIAHGTRLVTSVLADHQAQRLVVDTLKAYAGQQINRTIAKADLPDVIRAIMAATDIKLALQDGKLFVEQVSLTYRSGATGTFVMPSAQQIAQNVDQAVETLLKQRSLPSTNVTKPIETTPSSSSTSSGLRSIDVRSNLRSHQTDP